VATLKRQRTIIQQIGRLIHWPLMGGLLNLVQRGRAAAPLSPLFALPNVTAHQSAASV